MIALHAGSSTVEDWKRTHLISHICMRISAQVKKGEGYAECSMHIFLIGETHNICINQCGHATVLLCLRVLVTAYEHKSLCVDSHYMVYCILYMKIDLCI